MKSTLTKVPAYSDKSAMRNAWSRSTVIRFSMQTAGTCSAQRASLSPCKCGGNTGIRWKKGRWSSVGGPSSKFAGRCEPLPPTGGHCVGVKRSDPRRCERAAYAAIASRRKPSPRRSPRWRYRCDGSHRTSSGWFHQLLLRSTTRLGSPPATRATLLALGRRAPVDDLSLVERSSRRVG